MPDIGGKEKRLMKKKMTYNNAPAEFRESLNNAERIEDFLPAPEILFPKESVKKVTVQLSTLSIDFFKKLSNDLNIPYQKMIRRVLDNYARHYSGKKSI